MDIEKLYDEFGNYIGPEQQSDDDSDDDSLQLPDFPAKNGEEGEDEGDGDENDNGIASPPPPTQQDDSSSVVAGMDSSNSTAIVQAEDKQLYPSADQVFGKDVEVLVEEEDMQELSEPIIEPKVEVTSGLYDRDEDIPKSNYDRNYLIHGISPHPQLIRNIAIVGHLHHGKTCIIDMLMDLTHNMKWSKEYINDDRKFPIRYTDSRFDEQTLKISIKTNIVSLLLQKNQTNSSFSTHSTSNGKSYGFTILDTPGHPNFSDELITSLLLVDGVIIVIDVAEGVMMGTKAIIKKSIELGLSIVLVISKIDRLCMELRLPPTDAYHKIQHIIDSCNEIISTYNTNNQKHITELSPAIGNVAFISSNERVCFTLPQFAQAYIHANGGPDQFPLNAKQLARRFWGNVYYDKSSRKFSQRSNVSGIQSERTFVSFILKPYYKLHTAVVSSDIDDLTEYLQRNNLLQQHYRKRNSDNNGNNKNKNNPVVLGKVKKSYLNSDLKDILKLVNSNCFGMGDLSGFTTMLIDHIPSPYDSGKRIVQTLSKIDWPLSDHLTDVQKQWRSSMYNCDTHATKVPFSGYVSKLLPDEEGKRFDCLLRILSGTLKTGDTIGILATSYTSKKNNYHIASSNSTTNVFNEGNNSENVSFETVNAIFLPCARFKIKVRKAVAGQVVLVRGIDQTINKCATVVGKQLIREYDALSMRNINDFLQPTVMKVAIEPIKPSDLPKMINSLRMCSNSYPGLITKVEETGEHMLMGSGELYMDCILRDLREGFGTLKVEVKVSDPIVPFKETVSEVSVLQCSGETPANADNMKSKLVMVAEPLEESILNALDNRELEQKPYNNNKNKRDGDDDDDDDGERHEQKQDEEQEENNTNYEAFRKNKLRQMGWDALAAKSLWTFGPDNYTGPNALINDVLGTEARIAANDLRDSVVQGFNWAVREGPLADEPVRGVKVRVLEAQPSSITTKPSSAIIIPTARRVVFSSILTANPRMMEPVNEVEILCPGDEVAAAAATKVATTLVTKRRGIIIGQEDVAGTALRRIMVHMPVLDSFGFEPDLRTLTHGVAFCTQRFSHWQVVPGDPLDKSVTLRPLEAAGRRELAREVMIKTRRRKGLGDEVSLTKYLDDPLFKELAADHEDLRRLMN